MTAEDVRRKLDAELKEVFPDQFVATGYGLENSLVLNIEGEFTLVELDQLRDLAIKADEQLYGIEEGE